MYGAATGNITTLHFEAMPMAISDEALLSSFSRELDWLRADANIGLPKIATMAVLIWQATASKASWPQIERILLWRSTDTLLRKQISQSKSLVFYWQKNSSLPDFATANSMEAARKAVLTWLALKDVNRVEQLHELLNGVPRTQLNQVSRISAQIAGALRNGETATSKEYQYTPADFAFGIVNALSSDQAQKFCEATTRALSQRKDC